MQLMTVPWLDPLLCYNTYACCCAYSCYGLAFFMQHGAHSLQSHTMLLESMHFRYSPECWQSSVSSYMIINTCQVTHDGGVRVLAVRHITMLVITRAVSGLCVRRLGAN